MLIQFISDKSSSLEIYNENEYNTNKEKSQINIQRFSNKSINSIVCKLDPFFLNILNLKN